MNPATNLTRTACVTAGGTWEPSLVIYPTDDGGNVFDWPNGKISISGTPRDLVWIYGDWLAPLPRSIAKLPASTNKVCTDPRYTTQATCEGALGVGNWIFNAGVSYSCGRCHTTGWTSDPNIITTKEPERSFPGITFGRSVGSDPNNVVNLTGGVFPSTVPNFRSGGKSWMLIFLKN